MSLAIGIGIGLTLSPAATAAYNYYVDAATGDDGDDGLTPATAWATLSKIDSNIVESGRAIRVLVKSGTYDTADDYVAVEMAAAALAAGTVLRITFEAGCIMDGTAANAVASTDGFELSGDNAWTCYIHGNGLQIDNYRDAAGPTSPNGVGNRGANTVYVYDVAVDGAEDGFSSHGDATMHLDNCSAVNCTKTPVAHVDNAVVTHTDCTFTVSGTNFGGVQGDSATATYTRCTFIPDQSARTIDVRNSTFTQCELGTASLSLTANGALGTNSITDSFVNLYVDGDRLLDLTRCFGKLTLRVRPGGTQNVTHCVFSGPATGQSAVILGTSDLSGAQTLAFNDNILETATAAAFMNVNATNAGYLVTATAEFFNNCLSGSAAYDADLIAADSGGTVIVDTVSADALIGAANTMAMADYAYGDGSPCIGAGTGGSNIGFGAGEVVTVGDATDTIAPVITSSATANCAENAQLSHALTADESVTWSITGGADQAQFEINGSTLRWVSNGTQDYEDPQDAGTNNTYVVNVRATDLSGNTADQTITITVTDVGEGTYPLDDAGTMPAYAHGTKKMASAYAGDCCRVVRASDSTTLDIGWDGQDMDFAAIATFISGTTGAFDFWYDQSGNGNHGTQTTAGSRMSYQGTYAPGGVPALYAATDFFNIPTGVSVNEQNFDRFCVQDLASSNVSSAIHQLGVTSPRAAVFSNAEGAGVGSIQFNGIGAANPTFKPQAGAPVIYHHRGTASDSTFKQGASDTKTTTAGANETLEGGFVGNLFTGGWEGKGFYMADIGYGRNLSAGEETALRAGLVTLYGCVETPDARVIFDGDSINAGNVVNYLSIARMITYDGTPALYNVAGGGNQIQNMLGSNFSNKAGVILGAYAETRIVFLHVGTNDLTIGGRTAAQIYDDIAAYVALVQAAGGLCITSTLLPNSAWNETQQTTWSDLNTLLRADYAGADGFADFQADATMGPFAAAANTALYSDGLHPTVAGNALLAPIAQTAINALI